MLTGLLWISTGSAVLAAVCWCAAATFRNGDQPGDARVTARLLGSAHPEETRPLAVVTVHNPAGAPVVIALRARAALLPAWLTSPYDVQQGGRLRMHRLRLGPAGHGSQPLAMPSPVPPGGLDESSA